MELVLNNLLSPAVLFFALGLIATLLRSSLRFPLALSQSISIFLLLAIGFKGGKVIAEQGLAWQAGLLMLTGAVLSFALPIIGYMALRYMSRLNRTDAAAVAAHYGSVSVVTFMAAISYLQLQGAEYSGHMVALMVIMEIPAVISGIWLARRHLPLADENEAKHALFSDGSVLLLLGGMSIGVMARGPGLMQLETFLLTPLYGALCLFLLDLGLKAGRELKQLKLNGHGLSLFGILMPLFSGLLALIAAHALDLNVADTTLLCVLAASASYIVVPAALQVAVPQANVSLGTTVSMGITFPFNLIVGIPLYYSIAQFQSLL